ARPVPICGFTYQLSDVCLLPVIANFNNNSIGALSYSWDFDNGLISTMPNPSIALSMLGTYDIQLIAENQFGCRDTSSQQISITPPPVASFTLSQLAGCEPVDIVFDNTTLNGSTYFWLFGDGSSSSQQTPTHTYATSGTYSVTLIATATNGCVSTATSSNALVVSPSPVADFNWTFDTIPSFAGGCQMENLSMYAQTYQWDFGDGSTSVEEDPDHRYDYPGEFIITLIADRGNGCLDTIERPIFIDYFFGLFIPNAFTPLTGVPEVRIFKPAGVGIKEYHIWIFNKWGNIIWESTELENGRPKEGWDGYYQGELCQQDAYVWKVWAVFENGVIWPGKDYGGGKVLRTGTANLIR
ncbi:MAG: PKD domain-containing protein, partial [Bacteroidota bacterium]